MADPLGPTRRDRYVAAVRPIRYGQGFTVSGRFSPDMTDPPDLEAYRFGEMDRSSFEAVAEAFEWQVPETFNIADYVCDRWADERKNAVAVYTEAVDGTDAAYSFRQIRTRANQLAHYLRARGVERGDRIGVNGSQRVEPLIAHVAAFKLGAVSVPLSVLLGPDGLEYRLDDCEVKAFVVDEGAADALRSVRDGLESLETVLTMGAFDRGDEVDVWNAVAGRPRGFENVETDAEENACIIYTSGTTGRPKGAVHAHRHLLGILSAYAFRELDRRSVARTVAEWSWIMTLNGMVLPMWYYGVPVVGHDREEFDPEREFDLIEKYGVTNFSAAPTGIRMMMQVEEPTERWDLGTVRAVSTGGAAVSPGIIEWIEDVFENADATVGYGQSEVGALVNDKPQVGLPHRPGYLGVPNVGHETAVLDPETLEPMEEPGEVGELAVRYEGDPMLFKGYWENPERTAEKIREGWLLCEDLVSMAADGYVKFHSRKDDVIVSSGYRIGPAEIEDCLSSHDAVFNAGVIGVPHETRGEVPKAFVELADGHEPGDPLAEELRAYVKGRLAKYEYPHEIEFVAELPLTSTGKVRRQRLREREGVGGDR